MTSREEALREVLLEAADEIDASRLPPLRLTERGWGRSVAGRGHRARRLSRVLIPLAAAGSVAAVTAGILSFGGVLGQRQPTPGPGAAHHGAHATRATATADSGSRSPPAGSVWVSATAVAVSGPWFVTFIG